MQHILNWCLLLLITLIPVIDPVIHWIHMIWYCLLSQAKEIGTERLIMSPDHFTANTNQLREEASCLQMRFQVLYSVSPILDSFASKSIYSVSMFT